MSLLSWPGMIVAAAAAGLLTAGGMQLHFNTQRAAWAKTELQWEQERLQRAQAHAKALRQALDAETRVTALEGRLTDLMEDNTDAQENAERLQRELAGARERTDGLLDNLRTIARTRHCDAASAAAGNATGSDAADATTGVLADLSAKLAQRALTLAATADARRDAGLTCVNKWNEQRRELRKAAGTTNNE